jgi:hypothetical protein
MRYLIGLLTFIFLVPAFAERYPNDYLLDSGSASNQCTTGWNPLAFELKVGVTGCYINVSSAGSLYKILSLSEGVTQQFFDTGTKCQDKITIDYPLTCNTDMPPPAPDVPSYGYTADGVLVIDINGSGTDYTNDPSYATNPCNPGSPAYDPNACVASDTSKNNTNPWGDSCTMGICCVGAPEYNATQCQQILNESVYPDQFSPQPDDAILDSDPNYTAPQASPDASTDASSIVGSVNALSDRMADFFSQMVTPTDIANQTDSINNQIQKSAIQQSQVVAASANLLNQQMINQGNKVSSSIVNLNNNVVSSGILTRSSIDGLSTNLNGLGEKLDSIDAGIGGVITANNNNTLGITNKLDELNTSIQGISGGASVDTSIWTDIYDFLTQDTSVDLGIAEPAVSGSLDSYKTGVETESNQLLTDMQQQFSFDVQTYSFIGTTPYATLSFAVKGQTFTVDPWPLYMLASLIGIFISIGAGVLALRIVLGG